jgi:hypothetical protein
VHGDPLLREVAAPLWDRIGLTDHFLPASFWLRINETGDGMTRA